jgi:hypothetical protein
MTKQRLLHQRKTALNLCSLAWGFDREFACLGVPAEGSIVDGVRGPVWVLA